MVIAPSLLCAPGALVVARIARASSWLHIQDFELDIVKGLRMARSRVMLELAEKIESFLVRRFDRVSTISTSMLEKLGVKGVPREKRVLFPNWVDTRSIRPLDGRNSLRTTFGISDDVIVLQYAGNIGEKQGLDVIVSASERFSDRKDILFVFAGDGVARQRLEALTHNRENIIWLPLQPSENLNDLLNFADIHLLPQQVGAEDAVMPSKLTGMLASGRPVVAMASEGTPTARAVDGRGLVTRPGDLDAFVGAINELVGTKERRIELGRRARKYAVECLDVNKIMQDFESEMHVLMQRSPN